MKESNWNWYSVKIIKKLNIKVKPKKEFLDEYYDDKVQNFEESIVIVKAQSFEHAYKTAEKKVLNDSMSYYNIYGQEVSWDFIEAVDCFLIDNEIRTGTEIYSCFYKTSKSISDDDFIENNILKDAEQGCRMARQL